eukprot:8705228-Pyramimonas_sp.AAC.1
MGSFQTKPSPQPPLGTVQVFVEGAKRLNETERESLLCRRMKEIFEIATPQRDTEEQATA